MDYSEFIERYSYSRIQHLGLAVENIEEALETVCKAEIRVIMEAGGYGLDGDDYFVNVDTKEIIGINLELMERPLENKNPIKFIL